MELIGLRYVMAAASAGAQSGNGARPNEEPASVFAGETREASRVLGSRVDCVRPISHILLRRPSDRVLCRSELDVSRRIVDRHGRTA
jgi:hypothetical protein